MVARRDLAQLLGAQQRTFKIVAMRLEDALQSNANVLVLQGHFLAKVAKWATQHRAFVGGHGFLKFKHPLAQRLELRQPATSA